MNKILATIALIGMMALGTAVGILIGGMCFLIYDRMVESMLISHSVFGVCLMIVMIASGGVLVFFIGLCMNLIYNEAFK